MIDKKLSRLRRAAKTRATIARLKAVRMTVHRTNTHIYAQIIDASGAKVLAAASTVEKEVRGQVKKRCQQRSCRCRWQAYRRACESGGRHCCCV